MSAQKRHENEAELTNANYIKDNLLASHSRKESSTDLENYELIAGTLAAAMHAATFNTKKEKEDIFPTMLDPKLGEKLKNPASACSVKDLKHKALVVQTVFGSGVDPSLLSSSRKISRTLLLQDIMAQVKRWLP